jgi:HD-like signal output (HDOD) protein
MAFPVSKLLDDVVRLCPLPSTTKKVIELADSDRSSIGAIVAAISTDPALATAVLRVANSALYGGMKVSQLDAAVIRIGLRELRELATAMSVLAAFRSKEPVQAQLHERSVMGGGIANKVAKATRLSAPATAATCGLLSEIGAMACFAADAKEYGRLWKETLGDGSARVARERERYGVASFDVGRRFLERNGLPEEVFATVGAELGGPPEDYTAAQRICLVARHSSELLLTIGADDEARTEQALDRLASMVGLAGFDGKTLYELYLREGLLRDLSRR